MKHTTNPYKNDKRNSALALLSAALVLISLFMAPIAWDAVITK